MILMYLLTLMMVDAEFGQLGTNVITTCTPATTSLQVMLASRATRATVRATAHGPVVELALLVGDRGLAIRRAHPSKVWGCQQPPRA